MDQQTAFVVDNDPLWLEQLQRVLHAEGVTALSFDSAEEFLRQYRPSQPGCLVADACLPGLSGLELQEWLAQRGEVLPVIMTASQGTVPMAVQAIKRGALDFLMKPLDIQVLRDLILAGFEEDNCRRHDCRQRSDYRERLGRLTRRELEVINLIVTGRTNKAMAAQLGISTKTVEAHRAKIMLKTQAESTVDLVRIVDISQERARGLMTAPREQVSVAMA